MHDGGGEKGKNSSRDGRGALRYSIDCEVLLEDLRDGELRRDATRQNSAKSLARYPKVAANNGLVSLGARVCVHARGR